MAKAIQQLGSLTVGFVRLGEYDGGTGSVRRQVYDGDTITTEASGNLSVRFLGVDAPEMKYKLSDSDAFLSLDNPKWETFLEDPFDDAAYGPLSLGSDLERYLKARTGAGTASNHHRHAEASQRALEELVMKDMQVLGQDEESFQFFLAFAHEVMDRYGRLLAYLNRNQPDETQPEPRPRSYNERLLEGGHVLPYFIWPNLDPFREKKSLRDAVVPPGGARSEAERSSSLTYARNAVRDVRDAKQGVFQEGDPLKLEPFEVRFLADRRAPSRWVIDLSKDDDTLIPPEVYHTVPNPEDRLFVPDEYVPLFEKEGWKV